MSKKVLENLAAKYKNVKKGVSDIMGGQVLEHEGKTIYNAGIKEGEERGRREANLETARRLRDMGMSDNDIHRATNISIDDLKML
jgi:predicted transposase/invertase (TIGR01784 family)